MGMALPKAMSLTDAAAERVRALVVQGQENEAGEQILGLRVGVKSRGCSGLSYVVEYAKERKKFEEMVEDKGVKIFIDPAATMFLLGSEMDYVEDALQSGFVFKNPNEKSRCGCGESFSV
jgi:iron-sulfur cluster assembly accessory protein